VRTLQNAISTNARNKSARCSEPKTTVSEARQDKRIGGSGRAAGARTGVSRERSATRGTPPLIPLRGSSPLEQLLERVMRLNSPAIQPSPN
jgi:hypothetical protein